MEKALEVRNLVISFKTNNGTVKAVRDVSFDLVKGETLAIVGESGSGKSVTSRAIMGILAGNAIVEGGEILYKGQDLLKISEDDFHKIRGDKIAMIFQDPMSSLNPIMRIGKQLTEAMILKNRVNRKEAKKALKKKIKYLEKEINIALETANKPGIKDEISNKIEKFNKFQLKHLELEREYNLSKEALLDALDELKDLIFDLEKSYVSDVDVKVSNIVRLAKKTLHQFLVNIDKTQFLNLMKDLQSKSKIAKKSKNYNDLISALKDLQDILNQAADLEKPNFFTLAYYILFSEKPIPDVEISELNKLTRKYLDDDFMLDFIDLAKKAITSSYNKSLKLKEKAIVELDNAVKYFSQESIDKKEAYKIFHVITSLVNNSIDKLAIEKDIESSMFKTNLSNALGIYFTGKRKNKKEQSRYDRQMARFEALSRKGKTPDWKVVPPDIIDMNLAKTNIVKILNSVITKYKLLIQESKNYDFDSATVALIDFLKEKGALAVHRVTSQMAKRTAIRLMEEVGIPEAKKRFRQYPFQFSGGMRQRIVIAIALAANPDVLICDEPTTALDVTIQAQILELINKLKHERNISVIFITHDLGVVANMADRIAVMYAGKIVEYGTADDVFYTPAHPYTWALLSSMPDLDTKEKLEAIPGTPPNMIYPPKGDAFAARNKYALKIDFEEEPPMFKITDTHFAATWLLHPNAPKVEPPKIVVERIQRMKRLGEIKNGGQQ